MHVVQQPCAPYAPFPMPLGEVLARLISRLVCQFKADRDWPVVHEAEGASDRELFEISRAQSPEAAHRDEAFRIMMLGHPSSR